MSLGEGHLHDLVKNLHDSVSTVTFFSLFIHLFIVEE